MIASICKPVVILFLINCLAAQAQITRLRITITGIESKKGIVRVALYDRPAQFPYHPARKFILSKEEMQDNALSMVITDIEEGEYVISLLDDVNGNDEMDYNLLHMPVEGYGFSNDIRPGLRPPPYEKCIFPVRRGDNHLQIRVHYFGR